MRDFFWEGFSEDNSTLACLGAGLQTKGTRRFGYWEHKKEERGFARQIALKIPVGERCPME